jgi:4-hydroxymandelate oxidase
MTEKTMDRLDLAAIRQQAEAALSPPAWDFIEGGALDEETLARNERRFVGYHLCPAIFRGVSTPACATTFLDLSLSIPVVVAPFAGDAMLSDEGFVAVARAAARAGTVAIVPELASASLEKVAQEAPEGAGIFQITPFDTAEQLLWLAARAAGAGYRAICLTADAAVGGIRRRSLRHPFDVQKELEVSNWWEDAGFDPRHQFRNLLRRGDPDWTWDAVTDVAAECPLPLVIKGIMTARDAAAATAAGAAAIYVSNHGGRQLGGVSATIDVLPEVVQAVSGTVPVVLDGGVRSGTDVVRALALGADLVAIGRPAAWGLAASGEEGVLRVLQIFQHEIETTLTLLGCDTPADLDPSHVVRRPA